MFAKALKGQNIEELLSAISAAPVAAAGAPAAGAAAGGAQPAAKEESKYTLFCLIISYRERSQERRRR